MNQTLKYYTLIETCKNVGLNVKEYFAYVSVNLYRARGITKDFLPVLSHGKFKLTKVKTEIISALLFQCPLYRGEVIECLLFNGVY